MPSNSRTASRRACTDHGFHAQARSLWFRACCIFGLLFLSPKLFALTDTVALLYPDASSREPAADTLQFPVGSISKTVTAVLTLKLAAEGRLTLDDPLSRWLPELSGKLKKPELITLRFLLDHRSGIYNYTDLSHYQHAQSWPLDQALDAGLDERAYFRPGEGWHYSNTNYLLLQKVLEKASGLALDELFRQRIAIPLRLVHSGYFPHGENVTLPPGYHEAERVSAPREALADAGFITTAPELLRLIRAIFTDDRFLSPRWRREMTHFVGVKPEVGAYGLGLVRSEWQGTRYWWHSGFLRGYLSAYYWFPDQGQGMVIFVNRSDAEGKARQQRLFEQGACRVVQKNCRPEAPVPVLEAGTPQR